MFLELIYWKDCINPTYELAGTGRVQVYSRVITLEQKGGTGPPLLHLCFPLDEKLSATLNRACCSNYQECQKNTFALSP